MLPTVNTCACQLQRCWLSLPPLQCSAVQEFPSSVPVHLRRADCAWTNCVNWQYFVSYVTYYTAKDASCHCAKHLRSWRALTVHRRTPHSVQARVALYPTRLTLFLGRGLASVQVLPTSLPSAPSSKFSVREHTAQNPRDTRSMECLKRTELYDRKRLPMSDRKNARRALCCFTP